MLTLAIAALAVVAALVAGVLYLVHEVVAASARDRNTASTLAGQATKLNDLSTELKLEQDHSRDLDAALTDKTQALAREVAARKLVEKDLEDALAQADPRLAGAGVRAELSKLSQLSGTQAAPAAPGGNPAPTVPGPATPAPKPRLP